MTCPGCQNRLTSVIKYFSEHQAIALDEQGEVTDRSSRHHDGVEDIACGHCLKSLTDSEVVEIRLLLDRLSEI